MTVSSLAVVVIVHIDACGVVQGEVLRLTPQKTYGMVGYCLSIPVSKKSVINSWTCMGADETPGGSEWCGVIVYRWVHVVWYGRISYHTTCTSSHYTNHIIRSASICVPYTHLFVHTFVCTSVPLICPSILTKSLQCCLGFNCVTQTFRFPVVLPHLTLGQTLAEIFSILFVCSL